MNLLAREKVRREPTRFAHHARQRAVVRNVGVSLAGHFLLGHVALISDQHQGATAGERRKASAAYEGTTSGYVSLR